MMSLAIKEMLLLFFLFAIIVYIILACTKGNKTFCHHSTKTTFPRNLGYRESAYKCRRREMRYCLDYSLSAMCQYKCVSVHISSIYNNIFFEFHINEKISSQIFFLSRRFPRDIFLADFISRLSPILFSVYLLRKEIHLLF